MYRDSQYNTYKISIEMSLISKIKKQEIGEEKDLQALKYNIQLIYDFNNNFDDFDEDEHKFNLLIVKRLEDDINAKRHVRRAFGFLPEDGKISSLRDLSIFSLRKSIVGKCGYVPTISNIVTHCISFESGWVYTTRFSFLINQLKCILPSMIVSEIHVDDRYKSITSIDKFEKDESRRQRRRKRCLKCTICKKRYRARYNGKKPICKVCN